MVNNNLVLLTSSFAAWTNMDNTYVFIFYQVVEGGVLHLEIRASMFSSRCIVVEINSTTCCIMKEAILNQHIIHMGIGFIVVRDSPIHPASELTILESVCTCIRSKCTNRIVAYICTIEGDTIERSSSEQLQSCPFASEFDNWFCTFSCFEHNTGLFKRNCICLFIYTVSQDEGIRLGKAPSEGICSWRTCMYRCLRCKTECQRSKKKE